jgi:hypothetical protein
VADFSFEYDAAEKIFAVRMTGAITDDVFKACYAETLRRAGALEIRAALIDLSAVDRYDVSAAAMREAGKSQPLFPDPTPRYLVATSDHVFGMARMLQLVSTQGREALRVVRSVQEAYDAIGVPAPHFEPLHQAPRTKD